MTAAEWRAATDRVAAALGINTVTLGVRLGYADPRAIYNSRRSGAPAPMVVALRAVAADAPPLPEEGIAAPKRRTRRGP